MELEKKIVFKLNLSDGNLLTIAIPTYNRNEILLQNLSKLLPQIHSDIRVVIYDNCSAVPVEETLRVLNPQFRSKIDVVRNRVNVGMTGNILKCFEGCDTEWLWILGDDDRVEDNAINIIFQDIRSNSNTELITYAWDEPSLNRKNDVIVEGCRPLLDKIESFGVLLFLSTSIYNMRKVEKNIAFASFFQSSYAPHLVVAFMSIGTHGQCLISTSKIVSNGNLDTPGDLRWDQFYIYQLVLLLRLPLSPETLLSLRARLMELTQLWTVEHFIFTFVFNKDVASDNNLVLVQYDDIANGFFYLDKRLRSRVLLRVGRFVVRYRHFWRPILRRLFRILKGRDFANTSTGRI